MSTTTTNPPSEHEWIESATCYFSTAPQCTKLWDELHIGTVSASKLSTWLGLTKFSEGPEESALQCVGLSKKTFNSEQLDRTQIGIAGEPIVRKWYSESIATPISEVGVAVWKKDPRFRASLDGMYTKDGVTRGVEIKVTDKVYWLLIQHFQALKKGVNNMPEHSHIWDAHYNQMIQCIEIDRKSVV